MKKLNLISALLTVLIVLMGCKKECAFVYSDWTSCSNNLQTRTYTSSPSGCTGTPPADSLQRSCVMGKIGNQIWATKNLDVATYRNGDAIPQVQDATAWNILTTGAWCYYENNSANGTTYGKLYNWYAVNDPRGLAPTGYHIPTSAEWSTLNTYLGGMQIAGGKMKESGTSHWISPNTDATNSSGFTGLPGGYRDDSFFSFFSGVGTIGWWWTSGGVGSNKAWDVKLRNNNGEVSGYGNGAPIRYGMSVRCIKD